jgi:adenine deaminase
MVEKMKNRWKSLVRELGHDQTTFSGELEAFHELEKKVKGHRRVRKEQKTRTYIVPTITDNSEHT